MSAPIAKAELVCRNCGSGRLGLLDTVTVRRRIRATICTNEGRSYEYLTCYPTEHFAPSAQPQWPAPFECLDCLSRYELEQLDIPDVVAGQINGWS